MFEKTAGNMFPKDWQNIVKRWGEYNVEYYEKNEDLPAWYVENSNSALFSAAAWAEGHQALCEVDADKKHFTGQRGRPVTYSGRVDIELTLHEQMYLIEAKRKAFSLGKDSRHSFSHASLAASIEEAQRNARQCFNRACDLNAKTASIVFFSGHIDPEAPERGENSSPKMRSEMVGLEISKLRENMEKLGKKLEREVYYAVFFRGDYRIYKDWQGLRWPAAFGLCALIDA